MGTKFEIPRTKSKSSRPEMTIKQARAIVLKSGDQISLMNLTGAAYCEIEPDGSVWVENMPNESVLSARYLTPLEMRMVATELMEGNVAGVAA